MNNSQRRLNILYGQLGQQQIEKSDSKSDNTLIINKTVFQIRNSLFPQFIPVLYLPKDMRFSSEVFEHLKWMSQKDSMGQDMFLIGHPGPFRRRLAFMYCELTRREIEYVVITRDTTEHDIKQRREIQDRNAFYVDQAAVRAAIHGRILILDGIEKSERNILPVLNNLLENREMSLEDGRLLIDTKRYSSLNVKTDKIVPVHPDFRVIALGLPVPPYEGNSLDPPLRSRFQSRKFDLESLDVILNHIKDHKVPELSISAVMTFEQLIFQLKEYQEDMIKEFFPPLPMGHIIDLVTILEMFGGSISEEIIQDCIRMMYPLKCLKMDQDSPIHYALEKGILTCANEVWVNLKNSSSDFSLLDISSRGRDVAEISFGSKGLSTTISVRCGNERSTSIQEYFPLESHERVLLDMLISHSLGRDFLLVGAKGVGKSVLVRQFASLLGYQIEYIPMFKDMTLRDLFKRRTTDQDGNTIWQVSPLLDAVRKGYICILDGVDRLNSDILLSLQSLIHDRCLFLIDGSRYVSHESYHELKRKTSKNLEEEKIFPIHPNFRIIATGLPPVKDDSSQSWFSKEVLMLFHSHYIEPLKDECALLSKYCPDMKPQFIKSIVELKNDYNETKESSTKYISTRDLIRILRFIQAYPDDNFYEIFERTTMIQFLPEDQKQHYQLLLQKYGFYPEKPKPLEIVVENDVVVIGTLRAKRGNPPNNLLVPDPFYVHTYEHTKIVSELVQDHLMGVHSVLIGNQGVGKNKVTDYFLSVMKLEKEYMQLHRDITIQSLTVQPSVQDGVLVYIDSPLVRAVIHGRILMLDEADKAPLEVVSIIKSLVDDGEMVLSDNRRILKNPKSAESNVIKIHPDFRMIVLANRPGFPFQGNDFFRECGDLFSAHYVDNPRGPNEIKMLREYAPSVPLTIIERLTECFNDIREMVKDNTISYPYSTRELVSIVKHLERYPQSGIIASLNNVIGFDMFNDQISNKLKEVFSKHGIALDGNSTSLDDELIKSHALISSETAAESVVSNQSVLGEGEGTGEGEGEGGNGSGTGGQGGEGSGGSGGSSGGSSNNYTTNQAPTSEYKSDIYVSSMIQARRISVEALDTKLKIIDMSVSDLNLYNDSYTMVKPQISQLRVLLENLRSKEKERTWLKNKPYGEIDDNKIVEGITGEKFIYQKRGEGSVYDSFRHKKKKVLHFVFDCSSSMFRFNGYDKRLNRMMEVAVCVMESLSGFEDRFTYAITGHSGSTHMFPLVPYGSPPRNKKEMLQVILQIQNHATTCYSGDTTVEATEWAVDQAAKIDADERFVFVFSDANISAYGLNGKSFSKVLDNNKKVKPFVIFICSPNGEAERLVNELPDKRAYSCLKLDDLGKTFQKIFASNVLNE